MLSISSKVDVVDAKFEAQSQTLQDLNDKDSNEAAFLEILNEEINNLSGRMDEMMVQSKARDAKKG